MAPSHIETIDDAALEETNEALALARLHLGALLRVKNRLRSPLLRLPTEIIVYILSLTNLGYYHDWRSILIACHRINEIMREATEIWWKVTYDCTPRSLWAAYIAIARSKGTPRVLVADLSSWASKGQSASAKSFPGR
jgi:hypothetical protein